jgi:hypothetical protein
VKAPYDARANAKTGAGIFVNLALGAQIALTGSGELVRKKEFDPSAT